MLNKTTQSAPLTKGQVEQLLQGGDLRSIGQSNALAAQLHTQQQFDLLFLFLRHKDRKVVMRAADAIEKITVAKPRFLHKHKAGLLLICTEAKHKELQWHLAQLLPRLPLTNAEIEWVWQQLSEWVQKGQSQIVRVNALQAMAGIQQQHAAYRQPFQQLLLQLKTEKAPSLQARIKKIKQTLS